MQETPLSSLIRSFIEDDEREELEIVCPEPGTTLPDGTRFTKSSTDPEKMYQSIYQTCRNRGWMKTQVWASKKGRSVFLYKSDPRG